MTFKRCLACNDPIEWDGHGNRDYCSDSCYNFNKKERQKIKYQEQKEAAEAFRKTDQLLQRLHEAYGSIARIPTDLLEDAEMNWDIANSRIEVAGYPATVIGKYAYTLFKDKKVYIWKL
jgi:hypothetical protein